MDSSVRRFGAKTALEFFGARTSYRELGTQISRVAAGLKKLGVKPATGSPWSCRTAHST